MPYATHATSLRESLPMKTTNRHHRAIEPFIATAYHISFHNGWLHHVYDYHREMVLVFTRHVVGFPGQAIGDLLLAGAPSRATTARTSRR
jgi:hypothetical protein